MFKAATINRASIRTVLLFAGLAVIILLMSCIPATQQTRTQEPGWYGITNGWNHWMSDVNGKVGHRLFVSAPQGRCLPSRSWSADTTITSGSLPPGMDFGSGDSITGIPTKRGHWIVNLKLSNIKCGEFYYKDFTQELRFHISGTGRVTY